MPEFGILTLLPILVILAVAVSTRRTLVALFSGTLVGAVLLAGWGFTGSWVEFFSRSLSNETAQWLILIVALFGILITLYERSGIVGEFAQWLEGFVNSQRKSLVLSFVLSLVLFIDDYLNVLTVGTSMKPVTDRYRVPRTQLGAVMKMTAAPIAVIVPISTWALFFSGLFEAQGVTVGGSGFGAYLHAIPYIFFGWAALIIAFLIAMGWLPKFGLIKADALVAASTGLTMPAESVLVGPKMDGPSGGSAAAESVDSTSGSDGNQMMTIQEVEDSGTPSRRARPWPFLLSMGVLVAVTIATDADVVVGTSAALIVTVALILMQKRMTVRRILDSAVDGIGSMLFVLILTVLAFMVQEMNIDLGLADFVIFVTEPVLTPALLPALVFLVCGIYAYATGSFWDLAAVITPVVLPLAISIGADPILAGAAIFSGAALGSTTCLYGDGIILASRAIDIKPMQLMLAILPYAAIAGAASLVMYLIVGFLGV